MFKKDLETILNCMGGEDGGVNFIKFKVMMEDLETQDNEAAKEILLVVSRFAKLIEIAQLDPWIEKNL